MESLAWTGALAAASMVVPDLAASGTQAFIDER